MAPSLFVFDRQFSSNSHLDLFFSFEHFAAEPEVYRHYNCTALPTNGAPTTLVHSVLPLPMLLLLLMLRLPDYGERPAS